MDDGSRDKLIPYIIKAVKKKEELSRQIAEYKAMRQEIIATEMVLP
jgi:hypothetical protein